MVVYSVSDRMHAASARVTVCLLMTSFVAIDATGSENIRHVTATRLAPGVTGAQISRPTTARDKTATSHYDVDIRAGNGNRKQKYSSPDDPDYSASSSEAGTRQKRYACWSNRKQYGGGGLLTRDARSLVGVGWNKRPRYNRDGDTRDWRTNMMRVWGKRSGARRASGSALMTSLI